MSSGPAYSYIGWSIVIETDSSEYGRYRTTRDEMLMYMFIVGFGLSALATDDAQHYFGHFIFTALQQYTMLCAKYNIVYTAYSTQCTSNSIWIVLDFWKCKRIYFQQTNDQTGDIVHIVCTCLCVCVCDISVFGIFADPSPFCELFTAHSLPQKDQPRIEEENTRQKEKKKTKHERKPLTENGNNNNNGIGKM